MTIASILFIFITYAILIGSTTVAEDSLFWFGEFTRSRFVWFYNFVHIGSNYLFLKNSVNSNTQPPKILSTLSSVWRKATLITYRREFLETFLLEYTGWSILFLYTLNSSYNKNNICTKRIVADKCSVYRGISSKTINLKISKFLHSKKLNWKLVQFSPQNSTNYFEVIWGKYWHKSLTLDNPHSNIAIQFHFSSEEANLWTCICFKTIDFCRFYSFSQFVNVYHHIF